MRRPSVIAFLALALATALRAGGCVDWADDCTLNDACCPDGGLGCFDAGTGGQDGG
jgi:hypothetical protein